ncbi:MAG: hypothetical protein PW788_14480 [Micavibrio sp.]|nr:hypothetical protein [Micavibrio sp.]
MKPKSNKVLSVRNLALSAAIAGSIMFHVAAWAEEKEAPTAIPDTPAAIWKSVDAETDEMTKLIKAGTLEELHHHAFAVRDLVAALPDHSATLPADKLAKVKSDSKFVATLASRLDESGDAKDKTASEANLKKLEGVLDMIRANYPDIPHSDAEGKAPPASSATPDEKK